MPLRKQSPLSSRLKKVQKELSLVNEDLETLKTAPGAGSGGTTGQARLRSAKNNATAGWGVRKEAAEERRLRDISKILTPRDRGNTAEALQRARAEQQRLVRELGRQNEDGRFTNYLAGNIQSNRPLRQERSVQRNKAIVMVALVFLALIWILFRFFL